MPLLPSILLFILDAYAIYCLWREQSSWKRTGFWLAAILLLPPFGAILYLFVFRRDPASGEQ